MNDIVGQKFGNWTVLSFSHKERVSSKEYKNYYICKCKCGTIRKVMRSNLLKGISTSCGCLQRKKTSEHNATHGQSSKRIYAIWQNMKERCYRTKRHNYSNYGGRGIAVCDEWKNDFQAFYDWAMANGYKEDLTIDRINVNGNYEPNNCRWVTQEIQRLNKTTTKYITYKNETKPLMVWCQELGLNYHKIIERLNKLGWSTERAFETP